MRKLLARVLLAAWLVLLLDMTLRWFPGSHLPVNLVPFRSIRHDWSAGGRHFWVNLVGNLAYFVPAGVLLPMARGRPTSLRRVALSAMAVSSAVEVAQYASGRRVGDVDDVLLNVTGAVLGYALAVACGWALPEPATKA